MGGINTAEPIVYDSSFTGQCCFGGVNIAEPSVRDLSCPGQCCFEDTPCGYGNAGCDERVESTNITEPIVDVSSCPGQLPRVSTPTRRSSTYPADLARVPPRGHHRRMSIVYVSCCPSQRLVVHRHAVPIVFDSSCPGRCCFKGINTAAPIIYVSICHGQRRFEGITTAAPIVYYSSCPGQCLRGQQHRRADRLRCQPHWPVLLRGHQYRRAGRLRFQLPQPVLL
ncbi:unnamed protein product [Prorocentrum cordatum]|uniref:SREBP regulating gene protein n=1 Tax=Prorocentrum cordatum TaxID=2364126 RepID=A0ABN9YAB1_9DINO|nr:unnamed protein product [Polarella glacialis]